MRTQRRLTLACAAVAATLLAGCMVKTDKHGDSDNVSIATPFGGMQVKTNNQAAVDNIGIAVYPGAQPAKQDNDDGAADVNMNFAGYHLRVKTGTYRSSDPEAKVEAFYRTELKRYGDVIACHHGSPVGSPVKTLEGLTCGDGGEIHVKTADHALDGEDEHKLELKAGSKLHQHVVGIDDQGDGTKFTLIALDLPHPSGDDQ